MLQDGPDLVKLKLTTWASERIKDGSVALIDMDTEVRDAFINGYIDLGDDTKAAFSTDGEQIGIVGPDKLLVSYNRKHWQLYNPPKKRKVV